MFLAARGRVQRALLVTPDTPSLRINLENHSEVTHRGRNIANTCRFVSRFV